MTTLYPPLIRQELKDYHIFLDTNVFIYASKNESFFNFLVDLNNQADCAFTTIPSVLFEYTRGSNSATEYAKRTDFLKNMVESVNSMNFLNSIPDFHIVMAKADSNNKSYTDFLLAACLYQYRHVKVGLLTTDLKACPSFFPRSHLVTVEHTNEVVNFGVYQLNPEAYSQAAAKALEEVTE
ncbi:MAG TPA: type II toxin-antitoxin system VapC family toxin [Candidatus Limnocylindria bacterium]|nr:type II toxin-antitoxin system VapC family toxin [Candidatus Limnocylindria bacterium]